MSDIKITDGKLTLKNGELTIRSQQVGTSNPAATTAPNTPPAPPPLTPQQQSAQRQKQFYARRKAQGWKKDWIDPETQKLADELGGIEKIPELVAQLRKPWGWLLWRFRS